MYWLYNLFVTRVSIDYIIFCYQIAYWLFNLFVTRLWVTTSMGGSVAASPAACITPSTPPPCLPPSTPARNYYPASLNGGRSILVRTPLIWLHISAKKKIDNDGCSCPAMWSGERSILVCGPFIWLNVSADKKTDNDGCLYWPILAFQRSVELIPLT